LTVSEVTTIFLTSLIKSAEDFLGKPVNGAAISVPSIFTDTQRIALEKAAKDAGITVFQLLDEAAAAAAATATVPSRNSENQMHDRTQLIVDFGISSVSLALLSIREGLAYVLASSNTTSVAAERIDQELVKFFSTDFTKKTKIPLVVCPAPTSSLTDQRAEAKLRLAIEHTKRTISASPGAATCSVESLKEGMDYTGSINRMRFDMLASRVYTAVAKEIISLLSSSAVDPHDVDEIVYVGGTSCLPGLDERLQLEVGFREDVETPYARGTVVGGGVGDPTTILARGCAMQAVLLNSLGGTREDDELKAAFESGSRAAEVKALTKTIGICFPDDLGEHKEVGGIWIPIVQKETPLPVRRVVSFDAGLTEFSNRIAFEVWEVKEGIRIEKAVPPNLEHDDDEEDEPDEIETKHRTVKKETLLGVIDTMAKLGIPAKGKSSNAGKWFTHLEVQIIVGFDGDVQVELREVGEGGVVETLRVPAL
jgi:heat shock protein 1/8